MKPHSLFSAIISSVSEKTWVKITCEHIMGEDEESIGHDVQIAWFALRI